jgi:hypothetical protein
MVDCRTSKNYLDGLRQRQKENIMTTIQGNTQKTTKENAWHALCALTTELFPQFGRRSAAFAAACAQRPDLVAMSGAPVAKAASQGMRQAPPVAVDPSQSAVVKGCEARAASSQGTRQAPPVAPAMDAPSRSAVVRACDARAASSSQGTRQAPPVAPAAADPLERAVARRLMAAADPLGTGQAPLATPAAADPLERAVERLMAAGHTSTEAPGAGDPLQQACERLGRK